MLRLQTCSQIGLHFYVINKIQGISDKIVGLKIDKENNTKNQPSTGIALTKGTLPYVVTSLWPQDDLADTWELCDNSFLYLTQSYSMRERSG